MPSEPLWLPIDVVISYNFNAVQQTGENHVILSIEKLDGALARARQSWAYGGVTDTVTLGVIYMDAIARAHAFEQGNKRTGFDSGFVFMITNGWELTEEADQELLAVAFVEMLENTRSRVSFEAEIKRYIRPFAGSAG